MWVLATFVCVYTWEWVPALYRRLSSLCYWGFYVILALSLTSCAPDPGGRQGGDYVIPSCTGAVVMTVRPVRHCRLIRTGEHRAPVWSLIFKHLILYPVCMLGILLWFCWTHAVIYVYMYPDGFSEILWYVQSRNIVPLLILFIIYMYFVRNNE